jgi:AbiTii
MSQFSQLLNEAADAELHKLSAVLLKAKVFASRIRGRKLRQWIEAELMGYNNVKEVPSYRVVHPVLFGDFSGMFHSRIRNVHLSTSIMPKDMRNLFENYPPKESVTALEELAAVEEDGRIGHIWDIQIIEFLRKYGTQINDMVLNHAESRFSRPSILAVISAIRSRLVDLLIELSEKYPELEKRDDAVKETRAKDIDDLTEKIVFENVTIIGDTTVGDKYIAGQAGAIGPGANAHHMKFEQLWSQESHDLTAVAEELSRLRSAMRSQATETGHDQAVAEMAKAEEAARKGDGATMMERLSQVGQWGLKTANELGVAMTAHLIVRAMTGGQ